MRAADALALELSEDAVRALAERLAPYLTATVTATDGGWLPGGAKIAHYLDCPPSRVYALASAGRIPVQHDGSALIARRSDLDSWVQNGGGRRP